MTDTAPTAIEDFEPMDAKEDGPIETDGPTDPIFTNNTNEPPVTSSNAGYVTTSTIPTKRPNRMDDRENKPLLANPIPIGKHKEKDNNRAKFIALIVIILVIITGFLIAYFVWINPSEESNNSGGGENLIDETTMSPTFEPSFEPTMDPTTISPISTTSTTTDPTAAPTTSEGGQGTPSPSLEPTPEPTLEPTAEPTLEPIGSNDSSSSSSDQDLIMGVSIGGGIAALYIICCFFYCCCCKENQDKNKKKENEYNEIENDAKAESELAVHTTV